MRDLRKTVGRQGDQENVDNNLFRPAVTEANVQYAASKGTTSKHKARSEPVRSSVAGSLYGGAVVDSEGGTAGEGWQYCWRNVFGLR